MGNLTFVHLSDLHIQGKDDEQFLGLDTAQRFRAVVEHIRQSSYHPACFVISGDLIHDAGEAGYEHVKALLTDLESFGAPIHMVLGNHDNRVAFQRVILQDSDIDECRRYYHAHVIDGIKLILLDSRESDKVYGTFDDEQMTWLSEQLSDDLPSILVFHHHPCPTPFKILEKHLLVPESAEKLAKAIEGHRVIGILNGHVHFNNFSVFHGIPTAAGGHVGFTVDPYEADGVTFMDGSGYDVVTVKDDLFTVNPVVVGGAPKVIHHMPLVELSQYFVEDDV